MVLDDITVIEDAGITVIEGIQCNGIRDGKNGLGIVRCKGKVVGVFTTNKITAAPLIFTKKVVSSGEIEGIVVNSGNANAFTGDWGLKNAEKMAELTAKNLMCDSRKIAVASTGVIGVQLDMDWIERNIEKVASHLESSREASESFARCIMTTDNFPKEFTVRVDDVYISGVAKGAGMIAPNMATMLAFIFTDADFSLEELYEMLSKSVNRSFNVTVVDGDTSTNDMVLLVTTGKKRIEKEAFQRGLNEVCLRLAKMIARDGEGATKLIEVHIRGAVSENDAIKAAKSVVSSLLVKTAVFGNDPNWGRVIAALGYSGAELDEKISLRIETEAESITLIERGKIIEAGKKATEIMKQTDNLRFVVDLHRGDAEGYAIGCDLSYDYVRINAEYTT
jgi:glutamate N-acetyltransferase/amino-acid N-acetyltransferase